MHLAVALCYSCCLWQSPAVQGQSVFSSSPSSLTFCLSVNLPISLVHVPSPSHLFPSLSLGLSCRISVSPFLCGCFSRYDFPWLQDSCPSLVAPFPHLCCTFLISLFLASFSQSGSWSFQSPLFVSLPFSPSFCQPPSIVLVKVCALVSKWCINPGCRNPLFMLYTPCSAHTHTLRKHSMVTKAPFVLWHHAGSTHDRHTIGWWHHWM